MSVTNSKRKRMAFWFLGAGLLVLTLMLLLFAPGMGFLAGERVWQKHGSGYDEAMNEQVAGHAWDRERRHARTMTVDEVSEFLKSSIIPELKMENLPIADALEMVNEALRQQTTDLKRPKVLIDMDYRYQKRNWKSPQVVKLRVRNIPAGIALKYICDATKCQYWIDNGNVFVGPFDLDRSEKFANRFLDEVKIKRFEFEGGHFSEALRLLQEQLESETLLSTFSGFRRQSIYAVDAVAHTDAGPGNLRPTWGESIGAVRMENASVRQVLDELCRITGRRHVLFEGEIQILPPLRNEAEENAAEK